MQSTINIDGNDILYIVYECRLDETSKTRYAIIVPFFKRCTTQAETLEDIEPNTEKAIRDWMEIQTLMVEERKRLEQLERLVASKDYFYKAIDKHKRGDEQAFKTNL